jgi:hypothetical protein
MKKYIIISALAVLALVSCQKEVGSVPGNDTAPFALVGTSSPGDGYDSDCDVKIRFTANSATEELYYFIEPTATKDAREMDDQAYADYVVANGTKLDPVVNEYDGSKTQDIIGTSVFGDNTISAVAVGGGKKYIAYATFSGVQWTTLATGTFTSAVLKKLGLGAIPTKLQKCEQVPGLYRFPNLYADGYHYQFKLATEALTDGDGDTYYEVSVEGQETGLSYGSYGAISVRDVATWQGNTGYRVYNNFYPAYNYVIIWAQYYVAAGNLGYDDDEFIPD